MSKDVIKDAISVEDILGKDVLDPGGACVGVVDRVLMDPATLAVMGISVDTGFFSKGLIIGTDLVSHVTPHAVMLDVKPITRLRTMKVFDVNGKLLGKVEEVLMDEEQHRLHGLIVKGSKESVEIPSSAIERIAENIFLSGEIKHRT